MSTPSGAAAGALSPPRPLPGPLLALGLLAAVALSLAALDWDLAPLLDAHERGLAWRRLLAFLSAFGAPDLSSEALARGSRLALQTLAVALLGTLLGAALAWPLAVLASRAVVLGVEPPLGAAGRARRWALRALLEGARLTLDVLRGIPDFAWAILILAGPGPGPVTGILALGLSVGGILGKIYSELWDAVAPARLEPLRSAGAGRLALLFYGLQPATARAMLSYTLMRAECAVRNASVIGVVGGGGLGAELFDEFNFGNHAGVVTILLFLLVLTAGTDLLSTFLRHQLRSDPNHPRAARSTSLAAATRRRALALGVATAALVGSALFLAPAFRRAAGELRRIEWAWLGEQMSALLAPDLSRATLLEAASGTRVPLAMGLLGTLLAAGLAALLAFPASVAFQLEPQRFSGERASAPVRVARGLLLVAARTLALILRAVPEVAWLLILAAYFRVGPLPAVLALSIHSAGVLARVFVERVDDVPYRRYEQVFQGSRAATFLYGAVPSSARDWRTYALFQLEVNVRTGVVLGIVGAGGLGDLFHSSFEFWSLHRASTFLIVMVLLTTLIDRLARAGRLAQVAP